MKKRCRRKGKDETNVHCSCKGTNLNGVSCKSIIFILLTHAFRLTERIQLSPFFLSIFITLSYLFIIPQPFTYAIVVIPLCDYLTLFLLLKSVMLFYFTVEKFHQKERLNTNVVTFFDIFFRFESSTSGTVVFLE